MLNGLPKNDIRIFPRNYQSMYTCLDILRKRTAEKLQNPRLVRISFKSFRHWGGSMLAYYSKGNVLLVQKALRHRCVLNTMKYIHMVPVKDEDFEVVTLTTPEEIVTYGKAGWTKYDEINFNGVLMHFYKKPKRFLGYNT
jgi:integrase